MELIILLESPSRHRQLSLSASLATHREHIEYDHYRTMGPGGDIDVPISSIKDFHNAMWKLCNEMDGNSFILSRDTTFITGPLPSLTEPLCLSRSNHLKRKGDHSDAMVSSICYLMDIGKQTYDYEVAMPQVFDSMKLGAMMSTLFGLKYAIRTAYFNSHFDKPSMRMEDPVLPTWKHGQEVPLPVVTLGETCYAHGECIKWLNNINGTTKTRGRQARR